MPLLNSAAPEAPKNTFSVLKGETSDKLANPAAVLAVFYLADPFLYASNWSYMASWRYLFRPVNVFEERQFEIDNVARKTEKYMRTNPMDRVVTDPAYGMKVEHIRAGLQFEGQPIRGLILDIGGNTAGEATVLQQQGFNILVGDINQVALEISKKRAEKFGLRVPGYVALNALELPFPDNSFSAVTIIEALHHMPDYHQALSEAYRVLKPGGIFYSHEPNGWSPLRRASEIRDRLRGTIEKSFFISQLRRLCLKAGFSDVRIQAVKSSVSNWKAIEVPLYRRPIHYFHGYLRCKAPRFFGPLDVRARKPGRLIDEPLQSPDSWKQLLRNPVNGEPVRFDAAAGQWLDESRRNAFSDLHGIPIIIRSDARPIPQV